MELLVGNHVLDGVHGTPKEFRFLGEHRCPLVERPSGEDLIEQSDQLAGMESSVSGGAKPRVGDPLGMS